MWIKQGTSFQTMESQLGFLTLMESQESLAASVKYPKASVIASQTPSQSDTNVYQEYQNPKTKQAGMMLSQNWLSQLLATLSLAVATGKALPIESTKTSF